MILYFFDNQMPLGVSAAGADFLTSGIEDMVFVSLFYPDNRFGHVRASWLDPTKIRRLKVIGTKGMIVFDDVGADSTLKFYDEWIRPKGNKTFEHHRNFTPKLLEIGKAEPLRIECEHFVQCVLEHKKPLSAGQNGADVVRILEGAQTSLKQKGAYKSL
jgi:predicted dehydrogenase